MEKIKYIFFDCMETLIDMTILPSPNDYAEWAYRGSGVEDNWVDFAEFLKDYLEAKSLITNSLPLHNEFAMRTIFEKMAQAKEARSYENIADCLDKRFWENYLSKCYVSPEVKETVVQLSGNYKLGIVSNFKVPQGIETLIHNFGLSSYFEFITTSINIGWKKPHSQIYYDAIKRSGADRGQIIFVGDNYECDYLGPRKVGLRAVLLDKKNCFPLLPNRVANIKELIDKSGNNLNNSIIIC